VKNFFAVQEEIAGLIAQALSLKLTAGSTASTAAVNPEAMELYLRGRRSWALRTPGEHGESRRASSACHRAPAGLCPSACRVGMIVWLTLA